MRLVRLSPRFFPSKNHHAPAGTPEGRAVARILHELQDESLPLPGPHDRDVLLPPAKRCLARPIPSAGLLVCYVVGPNAVHVVAVMQLDPAP